MYLCIYLSMYLCIYISIYLWGPMGPGGPGPWAPGPRVPRPWAPGPRVPGLWAPQKPRDVAKKGSEKNWQHSSLCIKQIFPFVLCGFDLRVLVTAPRVNPPGCTKCKSGSISCLRCQRTPCILRASMYACKRVSMHACKQVSMHACKHVRKYM